MKALRLTCVKATDAGVGVNLPDTLFRERYLAMPKHQPTDETPSMTDLVAAGLALQGQGLALLLAEAKALATLIPGHGSTHPTEAETEADQDNMPV